ncbi:TrkH family potassium uptake protein [Desulfovibrio mangrovi]|uniref:TrkH family potassium uptake protein n=1 Tax=Desulfovibrio mangrovi TaxID=2976983 RepID=UPI002248244A|nr:TrkH family potassium uptake protein [Desulfovibrio mangrovi]UZP68360.1 TrkH family potassium uptake protein [Desulfovibrio mangrovi]
MRFTYCLYVIGALVVSVGLTMLFPIGWALYYQDSGLWPLVQAMFISVVAGLLLFLAFRRKDKQIMNHREGMTIVALGWLGAGLAGALPFLLADVFPTWTDCVFESISGFTTTGSSVMTDIEATPKSILMWRSLTHWLGGMGIIVMSLAILPFLGVGGMQLYKAEVPGPVPDKLKPRIKDTAMVLWKVYVGISVAQCLLLMVGGMTLFDAICHTFGTMATGGFSTKNASVGHYDSAYIHWVITIFMFIAGANFSLHYRALLGDVRCFWKDSEFRFYTVTTIIFTGLIAVYIYGRNATGVAESLQYAAFQVVSICTTTGFATADYELWLPFPQALLLFLMFLGGCAGSTGGGIKCMRVLLLLKQGYHELFRLVHPRAVKHIKLGGRIVPAEVMSGIWGFFILYVALFVVSSFLLSALGIDVLTAFAAVAACIGNIGPGLGTVGPAENFAHLPLAAKWILTWCMLLGRLEIYTVFILFVPEFWRK